MPTPAAPDEAPAAPYDLALLRQTAHGSTVFMNRILASFHKNTPGSVAELHTALATQDWPAAAALAHKLRPSLRLLGAAGLSGCLATVEAPEALPPARHTATEQLIAGLDELLQALPQEV